MTAAGGKSYCIHVDLYAGEDADGFGGWNQRTAESASQHEKRFAESDRLFMRLYKDDAAGKVRDEPYIAMSAAD